MEKIKEIFDKLDKKIKDRKEELSDINALIKFDLSGDDGGKWIVDLNEETLGIREGDDDAKCTFTSSDKVFLKLVNRELRPEYAIFTGKLKISGDIPLAMKLASLFKK